MPASTAPPALPPVGRRRRPGCTGWRLLVFVVALLTALAGLGGPVAAAADPEGGTAEMRRQLDEATRGYLDAKAKLDASKARQQQLIADLATVHDRLIVESAAVGEFAKSAYQSSGSMSVASVISNGAPTDFLEGITLLNAVSTHETKLIKKLMSTRDEANAAQAGIDHEIAVQQEQFAEMESRKQQAQQALWSVGGGQVTGGFSAAASVVAEASPRNADGSWPPESQTVYEPTSGGYITARTAHAKAQAQAAGFNRYVSCWRPLEDGGEHPRGRACDFAVLTTGFGDSAQGDDRVYGNNLAAFFLFNADRLGVLYIIWYRQIWLPGSGWHAYYGCCDPSSMHTNHVHVSMY